MAEESQEIKKGFSKFLEKFSADNAEYNLISKTLNISMLVCQTVEMIKCQYFFYI